MGGCALNCVANSKIKGKNIWILHRWYEVVH